VLGAQQYSKTLGFSHEAVKWLLQCPFILKVGKIDGEELVAVHAARRVSHYCHMTNIQGLQLEKHMKGLDTGCVKGGRLMALIYPGEQLQVISLKCKEYVDQEGLGYFVFTIYNFRFV
jgi:hypothetical protein